jgi:glucoamylase
VVNDVVNGTLLFEVADPDGDDNGPGNYAYPTAGDFHAGAYDLEAFQVYDTGSTVTFRVRTRDLTPTFGSPLGAQLVDVYVHQPGVAPIDTSTAASFPQRNYAIADADAWNRLVEVQGFGQRFVDAHGVTLGTVDPIKANAISRYITFAVKKAALGGTPASGWAFTVVLTGQDGFSPDQARAFQPVPQPYAFGVCAVASTDPHCTFDPNQVPKAMDVLTPAGVNQGVELDYTVTSHVVLHAVAMP